MNKLFSKIATLSVGLAMAVGVGVALGRNGVQRVRAEDDTIQFVTSGTNLDYTSGTKNNASMTVDGVSITFSSITGKTNTPARVQLPKNGTITSSLFGGAIKSVTVKDFAHTGSGADGSFSVKGSTDGTNYVLVEDHTELANSIASIATTFDASKDYRYFQIVCGGSRVLQLSGIDVVFEKPVIKTVVDVTGVFSAPNEAFVGDTINPSSVTLNVKYEDDTTGKVVATSVECDTSAPGNVTATATYSEATGVKTAQFNVLVKAVEVESIEASGTFKTSFTENEAFSFGSGKVKVIYNNETNTTIEPTAEGVTVRLGETNITGMTYYMQKADKDKAVTIAYANKTFQYTIAAVSDAEPAGEGYYSKVTDLSGIAVNSKYIIVSEQNNKAMSTTQNTNNRSGTDVTIDDHVINNVSASVEVFTLVAGTVTTYSSEPVTTYGFKTSDNKYIYAAGSSSNNRLRTSDTLNDNGSFMISFSSDSYKNAVLTATGESTNRILRFNSSNNIFACYGTATQASVQLYKFVSQEKSDDQKAVEKFVEDYMHLDDVNINNHSDTGACKGETGYYALAKAAYASLTADQKAIFASSEEFVIARGRERLVAWAVANGEVFNPAAGTFETSVLYTPVMNFDNSAGYVIIIAVITMCAIAFGVVVLTHKRKHQ